MSCKVSTFRELPASTIKPASSDNDLFNKVADDELGENCYFGGNGGVPPMDERIGRLEGKVDRLDARLGGLETSVARLETSVAHMQGDMAEIRADMRAMRSEFGSLRRWIIGTAIAVIAIITSIIGLQDMWYQKTLDRNWEIANKALDKIDAMQKEMSNRP